MIKNILQFIKKIFCKNKEIIINFTDMKITKTGKIYLDSSTGYDKGIDNQ